MGAGEGKVRVRLARAEDAAELAAMINALNVCEGKPAGIHTPSAILRDLLGPRRDFQVHVAERGQRLVGYTLFHLTYNSDLGVRGVWMVDLYVDASVRGQGVGRALMASVARWALAQGAGSVWWCVRAQNQPARRFYASLGAQEEDDRECHLDGGALRSLAASAPGQEAAPRAVGRMSA